MSRPYSGRSTTLLLARSTTPHSRCGVYGNWSKAASRVTSCVALSSRTSRASVSGLHETYTTRPNSPASRRHVASSPARGGSTKSVSSLYLGWCRQRGRPSLPRAHAGTGAQPMASLPAGTLAGGVGPSGASGPAPGGKSPPISPYLGARAWRQIGARPQEERRGRGAVVVAPAARTRRRRSGRCPRCRAA